MCAYVFVQAFLINLSCVGLLIVVIGRGIFWLNALVLTDLFTFVLYFISGLNRITVNNDLISISFSPRIDHHDSFSLPRKKSTRVVSYKSQTSSDTFGCLYNIVFHLILKSNTRNIQKCDTKIFGKTVMLP